MSQRRKTGVNPHSLPESFAEETDTAHDPAWASHLPRCPWPGGLTPYAGVAVGGESIGPLTAEPKGLSEKGI